MDRLRTILLIGLSLFIFCGVAYAIFGAKAMGLGKHQWYLALTAASTAYLLIALFAGGCSNAYGCGICFALACCWLGDVFGPGHFIRGLVFFLIGHFGFMIAFALRGFQPRRFLASLLAATLLFTALYIWMGPHVRPEENAYFLAYMIVIWGMVVSAGAAKPGGAAWLILFTAYLFLFSDLCLGYGRYIGRTALTWKIGYPAYYLSCTLFAWSCWIERRR